jgi:hypothetical protein
VDISWISLAVPLTTFKRAIYTCASYFVKPIDLRHSITLGELVGGVLIET